MDPYVVLGVVLLGALLIVAVLGNWRDWSDLRMLRLMRTVLLVWLLGTGVTLLVLQ